MMQRTITPNIRIFFLAILIAVLASASLVAGKGNGKGGGGQGGGDSTLTDAAVDVVLSDRVDELGDLVDRVFSDGQGLYSDGGGGVFAIMNNSSCDDPTLPACGDFLFDADGDYSRRDEKKGVLRREIDIVLDQPVIESDGTTYPPYSEDQLLGDNYSPYLNVDHVFLVRGRQTKRANFNTLIGFVRMDLDVTFVDATASGSCGWVITSPPDRPVEFLSYGGGGEERTLLGRYHVPFEMYVELQDPTVCDLPVPAP